MIWANVNIDREDAEVQIKGIYNSPSDSVGKNLIEIIMVIDGEERVLYTHNPSSMHYGDPAAEDVYAKYSAKFSKYVAKAKEYSLTQLQLWKKH